MSNATGEAETTVTGTAVATVEPAGNSVRQIDSGPWSGVELGELFSKGHYISARHSDIVRIGISLACWEVISQDVAKTPLRLMRMTDEGPVEVKRSDHPVARLLWRRPSAYYDWFTWLRMTAAYLAAARSYYLAARWDLRGNIREVQGIPSGNVRPLTNVDARRYFYEVNPQSDHDRIQWHWCEGPQPWGTVIPLLFRTLNGIDPISNADVARDALGLLKKMMEFQDDSFANGGMPIVAFSFPDALDDKQFDRMKKDLATSMKRAREEGKPILLEGNDGEVPTVTKLSLSALEQDFVKANAAAAAEVLRYYRVPPHKVMLFDSVKYDNMSAANRLYVDDTLVPMFDTIAEGLTTLLLSESDRDDDLYIEFDKEHAYNSDPAERTKIATEQWKAGGLRLDEYRVKIGQNRIGGDAGQMRMFSGNFVLVDDNNEVRLKAGGNAPGAEGDQAPQDDAGANAGK